MGQIKVELTKEEKIKLLDANIAEMYDIKEQLKVLQNREKELRGETLNLLKDSEVCKDQTYDNGIYRAYVYQGKNSYIKPLLVEQHLKVKVTPECYGVTTYDAIKIEKSEANDKAKKKDDKKVLQEQKDEVKFDVTL